MIHTVRTHSSLVFNGIKATGAFWAVVVHEGDGWRGRLTLTKGGGYSGEDWRDLDLHLLEVGTLGKDKLRALASWLNPSRFTLWDEVTCPLPHPSRRSCCIVMVNTIQTWPRTHIRRPPTSPIALCNTKHTREDPIGLDDPFQLRPHAPPCPLRGHRQSHIREHGPGVPPGQLAAFREADGAHAQGEVVHVVVRGDHGPDGAVLVGHLGDPDEEFQGGVVDLDVVEGGTVWSVRYVKLDSVLCVGVGGDGVRGPVRSRELNSAHFALRGVEKSETWARRCIVRVAHRSVHHD